uniref:Uncharacterized protein n=1 Tax=Caenorhabditis japonica TaxID=281687 RepID=A0A8R1HSA3_CAEJA
MIFSLQPETSNRLDKNTETRLFWSGRVFGETYEKLEAPSFNEVESGYLADDESDSANDKDNDKEFTEFVTREKLTKTSENVKHHIRKIPSSLFLHSDSDGFEEKAVL